MLPFLAPKKQAGIIMAKRTPDGKTEAMHEEGEHEPGLMAACEDMISAFHAKDAKALADAYKAAFEICESYPHEENESMGEDMV